MNMYFCKMDLINPKAQIYAENHSRQEDSLLNEIEAQFITDDLARDQDNGRAVSIGFEYSVDEMQAAGATASGHGGQVTRHLRFCLRSKRAGFLVAHRDPLDAAFRERAGDMIERVAHDAVTMLDAGTLQRLDDDFCDLLAHGTGPLFAFMPQYGPGREIGL